MAKLRRVTAKLFILITGVEDLRQVRQAHVSMFRDNLHQLPKSRGKGTHDGVMTWASVMAHAKNLPPAQVRLAISTINRHLDVFGQILARAEEDGIPLDPKVKPKKFRLREKKRSRDKWSAPIGWCSLNVDAWWAFGPSAFCFLAPLDGSRGRCGA